MSGTPPPPQLQSLPHLHATLDNSLLFRTESTKSGSKSESRSQSPIKTPSPRGTPNKSPRRINTDPDLATADELRLRVNKRIILCCDGTWQDGIGERNRSLYTNVLRLARTIHHMDERFQPPIPQIVFYQSGIGTENNFYSEYIEGTTGGSLADKVEEAYAFIAHNYNPGDEIFLFGFSRGAYTARMVAMFVGEIGVLDRKEMDHFAKIFLCYQKLGKSKKQDEIKELNEELDRWRKPHARGKLRVDRDGDTFTIKCVGVFDTVGSLGLPESLTLRSSKAKTIFGFPNHLLGEHVERAYQALALHEMRADFHCNKFKQTEEGVRKGQILKQCWFTGAHSDVGGGYKEHDLADVALVWMAAQVGDMLALDTEYLAHLPQPVAPWGQQKPHEYANLSQPISQHEMANFQSSSKTGIFFLSQGIQRKLPVDSGPPCNQSIHASVLEQAKLYPALQRVLDDHPDIVAPLLPLEEEMKQNWPYKPESPVVKTYTDDLEQQLKGVPAEKAAQEFTRSNSIFRRSLFRNLSVRLSSKKNNDVDINVTVIDESQAETVRVSEDAQGIQASRKLKKSRRKTVFGVSSSEIAKPKMIDS